MKFTIRSNKNLNSRTKIRLKIARPCRINVDGNLSADRKSETEVRKFSHQRCPKLFSDPIFRVEQFELITLGLGSNAIQSFSLVFISVKIIHGSLNISAFNLKVATVGCRNWPVWFIQWWPTYHLVASDESQREKNTSNWQVAGLGVSVVESWASNRLNKLTWSQPGTEWRCWT